MVVNKEERSEILRTGGTCCNLDPEPWTRRLFHPGLPAVFNEGAWSEEKLTCEVCQDTRGGDIYNTERSHVSLLLWLSRQHCRSLYSPFVGFFLHLKLYPWFICDHHVGSHDILIKHNFKTTNQTFLNQYTFCISWVALRVIYWMICKAF